MTYQPGIPTGLVDLNVDYQNLQNNFQALDTTFGVDHVTFSNTTPQNGYHEDIHFNPFSTTTTNPPNNYVAQTAGTSTQYPAVLGLPPTVAGIGQLWSAEVNDGTGAADTGLYWLSGNGLKTALTRNFQPAATLTSGYTFLPGGFIMQWGAQNINANTSTTIGFPKTFPNAFLNLQTTIVAGSLPVAGTSVTIFGGSVPVLASTPNVTVYNSQAFVVSFFWVAIGY